MPINGIVLPMLPLITEHIRTPSECLLLKNMFDPAIEIFFIFNNFSFTWMMHSVGALMPTETYMYLCVVIL